MWGVDVFLAVLFVGRAMSQLLPFLPEEVADVVQKTAWSAAWKSANTRAGFARDAEVDAIEYEGNGEKFVKLAEGLLSPGTAKLIKQMFLDAAWYTTNYRWVYREDMKRDKANMKLRLKNITASREVSQTLANNLKRMALICGWYTADMRYGMQHRNQVNMASFKYLYNKVQGRPLLKSVQFGKPLQKEAISPYMIVDKEVVRNEGNTNLVIQRVIKQVWGKTTAFSRTSAGRFTIGMKASLGFNFLGNKGGVEYSAQFQSDTSETFSEEKLTTKENTETRTFSVPPNSKFIISVYQDQLDLVVPYDLVLDFDGVEKKISGEWTGKAMSVVHTDFLKQ